MKKLNLACAALLPLFGCTGTVDGDSLGFGGPEGSPGVAGAIGSLSGAGGGISGAGNVAGSSPIEAAGGTTIAGEASAGGAASGGVASGGAASGGNCSTPPAVLPATVQSLLQARCVTCHGATPLVATIPSLIDYATLTAPSTSDPSKTNAVVSLARMQSTNDMRMPPAPGAPATAAEIAALQDFITQGYPKPGPICTGGAGGAGGSSGAGGTGGVTGAGGMAGTSGTAGTGGTGGGSVMDPLAAAPKCSSGNSWTNGNRGSASMNPGMACISCHTSEGEGPSFSIAGTVYPTGHEPDRCNSTVGSAGARIVIIGADGQELTLTPNAVGNFSARNAVKLPYQAKVTYQGRERLMLAAQTSGDCNACHTQNGTMKAPGRITVP